MGLSYIRKDSVLTADSSVQAVRIHHNSLHHISENSKAVSSSSVLTSADKHTKHVLRLQTAILGCEIL